MILLEFEEEMHLQTGAGSLSANQSRDKARIQLPRRLPLFDAAQLKYKHLSSSTSALPTDSHYSHSRPSNTFLTTLPSLQLHQLQVST